jgi:GNAT superfamily N-acetyltransferase
MLRVEVRELRPEEISFGAGVAGRGLRDNPMAVAVLGDDRRRRERIMVRMFEAFLKAMQHPALSAWRGDYVVGIAGMAPPTTCQLSSLQVLRLVPSVRPTRLRDVSRTIQQLGEWAKRDPEEAHWHVGPVAVEGGMRGMGIGSQLMEAFCDHLRDRREAAYLETDKPENVVFYERFGFEVIDEAEVLETPNWYMRREPA